MIPTKKEPDELLRERIGLENCYFCQKPTAMWHENTNNPVCQNCAKEHKVAELPDYGATIRANKRKKRKVI